MLHRHDRESPLLLMRALFLAAFALALAIPASAWSLIAQASVGGTGNTSAINTTGANLLVACIATNQSGGGVAPTDSQSNTWTKAIAETATVPFVTVWYVYSPSTSSAQTFSASTNPTPAIVVAAFSGSASSPLDQTNGSGYSATTSAATGSITPTQNNELLISCLSSSASNAITNLTVNDSFSQVATVAGVSGTNAWGSMYYLVQPTAAAINPTWSWTTASSGSVNIASFLGTGGGGGGAPVSMPLLGIGAP